MRLSLAEEFSTIHILNLRGNQRTAGEDSRREGGKVFGGGSRATVAVTILVKNPGLVLGAHATVRYTDIGDYLTREQKLAKVAEAAFLGGLEPVLIEPNEHGDWVSKRAEDFAEFMPLAHKTATGVFANYGPGVQTNRDAWVRNASRSALAKNMRGAARSYAAALRGERSNDPTEIKWSSSLEQRLLRAEPIDFATGNNGITHYRAFEKLHHYSDTRWVHRPGIGPKAFPSNEHDNVGYYVLGTGSANPFSLLATDTLPDLHLTGAGSNGNYFPRWIWEPVDPETLGFSVESGEVANGYHRVDNITDDALRRWRGTYGLEWSKDDVFFYVYGLMQSPDYRQTYAADLTKMLPRIPLVAAAAEARAFADAGRRLSELHIGYESVLPYPLGGLDPHPGGDTDWDPYSFFAVGASKMRFGGNAREKDLSVIRYNDRITLSGIPADAYRYRLGSRSGVEWIIDRYHVKTDKASGIVNDPNDWSREVGDPRYILDLLARVVTVSLETMKIVDALPILTIREEQ